MKWPDADPFTQSLIALLWFIDGYFLRSIIELIRSKRRSSRPTPARDRSAE